MSVALFDLGQRLRAATLARPVARSTFAPVLPPIEPVAITLTGAGALLRATDGTQVSTATGQSALSALDALGVSVGPEHRTLVIADRDTLSRLVELARSTDPAFSSAGSAAVIELVEPAGRPSWHRRRAERHRRLLRPLGARRAAR